MARKKRSRFDRGLLAFALLAVAILMAGAGLQYFAPWLSASGNAARTLPESPVLFNEIMSSNASAVQNEYGEYADWVEIQNVSAAAVNLKGWTISQAVEDVNAFTFPEVVLQPGECLLAFADGRTRNTAGYLYHMPFKLSSSGCRVKLFDPEGALADEAEVPKLKRNQVYRRRLEDGAWEISSEYTPGLENTLENHSLLNAPQEGGAVVISEIMAANGSYAPDSQGRFNDYIELFNASSQAVDLTGYFLSDSREDPRKWRFPEVKIPAGGSLLVYASGLCEEGGEELHAGFKLSSQGEEVVFSDSEGRLLSYVRFPALGTDQAYSLLEGEYTLSLAPTPGLENTAESARALAGEFARSNAAGVTLNELCASDSQVGFDWLELFNGSNQAVDLSGWGLSDDAGRPRRWQFPEGTSIQPGQYLGVCLSGNDGVGASGILHTNFSLAVAGGYEVVLADPSGEIVDRVFVPEQYGNVSYGRIAGREGFYYMEETTPAAPNASVGYEGRAAKPVFSAPGGAYPAGGTVALELSAEPGALIRYTLDGSEPTENSTLYTGPIPLNATSAVRAKAWKEGRLSSYSTAATYLFGASHAVKVVALTGAMEDLTGEGGLLITGSLSREVPVHVEIYGADGSAMLSQNCGLKIMGKMSRTQFEQKSFRLMARNRYESGSFEASLFENRPYAEYDSVALRASGQDNRQTRMRDSILSSLCSDLDLMYQETEVAVVYVNGQYWGEYNLRERVNQESIAQFMGWPDPENIDLLEGSGGGVVRGSNGDYRALIAMVRENGLETREKVEALRQYVDIENYLDYVAIQMFTCNQDLNNVRMYRNALQDGKWRWVVYDLDLSFQIDQNSVRAWLKEGGVGSVTSQDNTLFLALMRNAEMREYFLARMGELLATTFSYENISAKILERYQILEPEMRAHCERWGWSFETWRSYCKKMLSYAQSRPAKLIGYFRDTLDLSDAELENYFGDAIQRIQEAQ